MNQTTCPGCGAPWNGKRCRSCGYEPFREEPRHRSASNTRKSPAKNRKKHPLMGFLLLLCCVYSLMPLLRNWGQKLEKLEERNRSLTQEAVIPDAELLTLYQGEYLHIFTTVYDAAHLTDGLTLYVQNDSDRDLILHTDALLIDGEATTQQLYCKAQANGISKNWLRWDTESGSTDIPSVSFRLKAFDSAGNPLLTTDLIALDNGPETAEPYF